MNKDFKIGLIGFGNFGKLAACVLSGDFDVRVFHNSKQKKYFLDAKKIGVKLAGIKTVLNSDIIILTAPISQTEKIIKDISKKIKHNALLIDTCSVKIYPCRWLKRYAPKNIEIMGTHPMFGPTTAKFDINRKNYKLDDKQIVLCPLRISGEKLGLIKKYLKNLGLKVIITSAEEHDRQNAKTLSLVHFIGRSLSASKINEQKIYTPGYAGLLKILPHTTSDDWRLFYDMHNYNPFAEKLMDKYMESGRALQEKIVEACSENEFDFNRKMIDKIDKRIFLLLQKRFQHARLIGKFKKKQGLKIVDRKREREIINKKVKQTKLDKEFIKKLYKIIFSEAYKWQK
ncbi:prephenate dehydrogenase/arogenate dehydrogenase family protein [Candidatus Parcubacteria bacterium]|nr:prephenate dehydrogenase/arogenate dehydrogenase family protein [Candidatus Parcubacteria bacterium]